ncbi:MFS transporter, partial [Escherichia coli]|nr:MFS transporter [Escherichia coli]
QNAVARSQIGTITGAMNFFRSMMSSFTVAAFSAILLMVLGADISLAEGAHGAVSGIAEADMIYAFRFVFAAATVMLACASVCMILMEERPLAGPSRTEPVDMAE